ncbi:MAG: hypothetical protein VXZ72_02600 [Chlamydiota bacterium]|nr:hypothetical protein [Chlamydiota bacterium]
MGVEEIRLNGGSQSDDEALSISYALNIQIGKGEKKIRSFGTWG